MLPFVIGGTAIWAVAALVMFGFRDSLAADGHGTWLGICVAGFLVGLPGIALMVGHDARRRRRLSRDRTTPPAPPR
jgi:hypothetical protein